MGSFYPQVDNKNYKNTFYSMCISLDNYLSAKLLNNDQSRIIYSSTDYALIKRSGQNDWNNANLPFINYKLTNKEKGEIRPWFNFELYSQGLYVPAVGKKLRMMPVTFNFDSTYFSGRDDDWQYATDMMLNDTYSDSKFTYYLDFNGTIIENLAIINFQLDTSVQFTERDWLEKNNIWAFSINPSIQTNVILDNSSGFCVPKKVIIEFLVKKDLIPSSAGDVIEYQEAFDMTVDHFAKTVILNA